MRSLVASPWGTQSQAPARRSRAFAARAQTSRVPGAQEDAHLSGERPRRRRGAAAKRCCVTGVGWSAQVAAVLLDAGGDGDASPFRRALPTRCAWVRRSSSLGPRGAMDGGCSPARCAWHLVRPSPWETAGSHGSSSSCDATRTRCVRAMFSLPEDTPRDGGHMVTELVALPSGAPDTLRRGATFPLWKEVRGDGRRLFAALVGLPPRDSDPRRVGVTFSPRDGRQHVR